MPLLETALCASSIIDGTPLSAADVTAPITRQLHESSHTRLRGVKLVYDRGRLTMRGKLPSYYLRQLALAIASDAPAVDEIVDLMEVGKCS